MIVNDIDSVAELAELFAILPLHGCVLRRFVRRNVQRQHLVSRDEHFGVARHVPKVNNNIDIILNRFDRDFWSGQS
ncbi:MAG TPA: hypothetical protein VJP76_06865 [Candidatus Tumulicola sp.]|nr:hypothetical protein [Candidatus Tumulicola sp.]